LSEFAKRHRLPPELFLEIIENRAGCVIDEFRIKQLFGAGHEVGGYHFG